MHYFKESCTWSITSPGSGAIIPGNSFEILSAISWILTSFGLRKCHLSRGSNIPVSKLVTDVYWQNMGCIAPIPQKLGEQLLTLLPQLRRRCLQISWYLGFYLFSLPLTLLNMLSYLPITSLICHGETRATRYRFAHKGGRSVW